MQTASKVLTLKEVQELRKTWTEAEAKAPLLKDFGTFWNSIRYSSLDGVQARSSGVPSNYRSRVREPTLMDRATATPAVDPGARDVGTFVAKCAVAMAIPLLLEVIVILWSSVPLAEQLLVDGYLASPFIHASWVAAAVAGVLVLLSRRLIHAARHIPLRRSK